MEDNPYSFFINNIRQDMDNRLPAAFRLGSVSVTNPLQIEIAGTVQDKSALLKNSMLGSLYPGEQVLLLPIEDEQRYIIICKVVGV